MNWCTIGVLILNFIELLNEDMRWGCLSWPKMRDLMDVGTGGQGAIAPPPQIFCQPQKLKMIKITTYKSVNSNKVKIGS